MLPTANVEFPIFFMKILVLTFIDEEGKFLYFNSLPLKLQGTLIVLGKPPRYSKINTKNRCPFHHS